MSNPIMPSRVFHAPFLKRFVHAARWRPGLLAKMGLVLLLALLGQLGASAQVQLIHYTNTVWRYQNNLTDPGYTPADAWTAPSFDDSTWVTGNGLFGRETTPALYTDPSTTFISCQCPFNTVIPAPGQGGPVSTYFRTHINWTNVNNQAVTFLFTNYVDDAMIVYLNGVELFSYNVTIPRPVAWNNAAPSGAANPLGEGVPVVTNLIPVNLQTGDNVLAVQLQQVGTGSSDAIFTMALWGTPPTPVVITQNPTNLTVPENRTVNLTVGVTGTAPQFQWYRDSLASPILDATNQTYTISNSVVADTGDYFVVVSNVLNRVTSAVARLTVVVDTNGPVLLSARTDDTFQKIFLTWDETIAEGPAIEFGNYYLLGPDGNQVGVNGVVYNGSSVILSVPTLLPGTNYSLELDYQQDLVGNTTVPIGSPVNDPNGIVRTVNTFVIAPGFTRFQAYLNRPSSETLAQFVTLPVYPDGSSFAFYTNVVMWPQTAPVNIEQYVMRFSGLFVAPEDGLYKFGPDHDDDMRLRVFPTADPSGVPSELAAACCTGLLDGPTLDVTLSAGQAYYYELLVREFGGGDHAGISVILPSGATNSPISAQYLAVAFDPANIVNVGIAQQPQSTTVPENHAATFSVVATNTGAAVAYQWQVDDGSGFVNIPGATGTNYTTGLQPIANSGDLYRVLVTVPGRTVTSASATLTVVVDNEAPRIVAVRGNGLNAIQVTFNEAVDSNSALEGGNYTLTDSNGVVLTLGSPTLSADLRTVTIPTSQQNSGAFYTLHAETIGDIAGNLIADTNVVYQAWILSSGFALFQTYETGGGNAVADLVNHPTYPNNPRETTYVASLDSRGAYPNDSHEAYGGRMSGYFIPSVTTNYIFYIRSDDAGELSINTNAVNSTDPAGKTKVQEETSCCRAFSVLPTPSIAMNAGQPYYIEVLWKEGTGGDYAQVAMKHAGDPTNPDNLTPVPGRFLATLSDPVGASVTITQQPVNTTFVISAGATTLLDQTFNADNGGFTVTTPQAMEGPWTYNSGAGSWIYEGQNAENNHPNTSLLISPPNTVTTLGNVVLTFSHRHSFEGGSWDGGQLRVSVNGGAFTAVPASAFLQNGYNGTVTGGSSSELANQAAFVNESAGHAANQKLTSIVDLGLFNAGDQIRVQFFAGSDSNTRGNTPNWEIDSVLITQGNSAPSVTLRVGADAVNASGSNPPRFYQWYRNNGAGFNPIPGANGPTYTLVPTPADNGAQFRVLISIPGAETTSSTATLTVVSGTTQPTLRSSFAGGVLTFSWDAPARLQCTTSLTPPVEWQDIDTGGATTYTVNPSNQFNILLDAAQAGGGGRTGTGKGTLTLSGNSLLVDVVYSGLSADRNNDHFHAPAARGANAGVAYGTGAIATGTRSGTIKGTIPMVDSAYGGKNIAAQVQDLRNGLWYLNIHTTAFTGGEIRGQVDPAGARFYRLISP